MLATLPSRDSLCRRLVPRTVSNPVTADRSPRIGPALNASLDAIYVLAAVRTPRGRITDFRVTDVNSRALKLIGATRRSQLIDHRLSALMPSVRANGFFDEYVRVVKTGRPSERVVSAVSPPWRHARWTQAKHLHRQIIRLGDGVLVTVRDVTGQKNAEAVLHALPRHISDAQDAERRRVARELHDGVSQLLVSARFRLREAQRLAGRTGDAALNENLGRADYALGQALGEVRRISHALRPRQLDDMGLVAALSNLVDGFRERTGARVTYRSVRSLPELPAGVAETLYRIAQEALTNVERHARARHLRVVLQRNARRLVLRIADDGRGLAAARPSRESGLGLLHMRERAESTGGSLTVAARNGGGTEIAVDIPLPARPGRTSRRG